MVSDIQQGLLITGIGMGLVFVVIIFLWGLMALMMRVTSREKPEIPVETETAETDQPFVEESHTSDVQRQAVAAAVAVGVAMAASQRRSQVGTEQDGSSGLSPWQAAHRARQFQKN